MSYSLGKMLIGIGLGIALLGVLFVLSGKLPWLRLGRLPGDISYQRGGFAFYAPITTLLLLSAVLTLVLWILGRFRS